MLLCTCLAVLVEERHHFLHELKRAVSVAGVVTRLAAGVTTARLGLAVVPALIIAILLVPVRGTRIGIASVLGAVLVAADITTAATAASALIVAVRLTVAVVVAPIIIIIWLGGIIGYNASV